MSEVIEMAVPAVIPAHSQQHSAAIVTLIPRDDYIPLVSGLPLVDADPKVIARALRQQSWSNRAHFLNNILAASLENFAEMSDYVQGEEDKERFSEWAQLRLMRAIGEALHTLGDERATEPAAVALFYLSLDPMHRRAARSWVKKQCEGTHSEDFFSSEVAEKWPVLAIFHNMISLTGPGQGEVWREGIADCPAFFQDPQVSQ
jgi:hypothetical protein